MADTQGGEGIVESRQQIALRACGREADSDKGLASQRRVGEGLGGAPALPSLRGEVHEVAAGVDEHGELLACLRAVGPSPPGRSAQTDRADAGAGHSKPATLHVGNLARPRAG